MSGKAVFWALSATPQSGLPLAAQLVLIRLADHADVTGDCWPSLATLAREVGISRGAVIKAVRQLQAAHLLQSARRFNPAGDATSNRYHLHLDSATGYADPVTITPDVPAVVHSDNHPPCSEASTPVHSDNHPWSSEMTTVVISDDPNLTTESIQMESEKEPTLPAPIPADPEPPNATVTPLCGGARVNSAVRFEDFWAAWPSGYKKGKKACLAKWATHRLDALADTIIADVRRRQADDDGWRRGYIPNPETYLNQERWTDDIRPPATPAPVRFETAEERQQRARQDAIQKAKADLMAREATTGGRHALQ